MHFIPRKLILIFFVLTFVFVGINPLAKASEIPLDSLAIFSTQTPSHKIIFIDEAILGVQRTLKEKLSTSGIASTREDDVLAIPVLDKKLFIGVVRSFLKTPIRVPRGILLGILKELGYGGAREDLSRIVILDDLSWVALLLERRGLNLERVDGGLIFHIDSKPRVVNILISAINALDKRLKIIQSNLDYAEVVAAVGAQPYQRQIIVIDEQGGVSIGVDSTPFRREHKPEHKMADAEGSVVFPNVYPVVERADMKETALERKILLGAITRLDANVIAP